MNAPSITVVGSVNLDLVATGQRLPAPGETVTGATLARHPGGKGANQALAARRLGARVALLARVGADTAADEALALLKAAGVDLSGLSIDAQAATGVALIAVADSGENQIIVAPGANASLGPQLIPDLDADAVICQLELPVETVAKAAAQTRGLLCLNLAPARSMPPQPLRRANLLVVNDTEAAFYGEALQDLPALIAVTHGSRGAELRRNGKVIATAAPPPVRAMDSTGAGDAFVAALTLALLEQREPAEALRFACAAGALAATQPGAQPSLPLRTDVEKLLQENPA